MFSLGMATIIMYLAAVAAFLLGVQYTGFFTIGMILGALLFIAASAILVMMMQKRRDIQDF